MDVAAKAAQAEARNKLKNQTAKKDADNATVPKVAAPDSSAPKTPEPPKTPGLFDVPPVGSPTEPSFDRSIARDPAASSQRIEEDREMLADNGAEDDAEEKFGQNAKMRKPRSAIIRLYGPGQSTIVACVQSGNLH